MCEIKDPNKADPRGFLRSIGDIYAGMMSDPEPMPPEGRELEYSCARAMACGCFVPVVTRKDEE